MKPSASGFAQAAVNLGLLQHGELLSAGAEEKIEGAVEISVALRLGFDGDVLGKLRVAVRHEPVNGADAAFAIGRVELAVAHVAQERDFNEARREDLSREGRDVVEVGAHVEAFAVLAFGNDDMIPVQTEDVRALAEFVECRWFIFHFGFGGWVWVCVCLGEGSTGSHWA